MEDKLKALTLAVLGINEESYADTFTQKSEDGETTVIDNFVDVFKSKNSEKLDQIKKTVKTDTYDTAFSKATENVRTKYEDKIKSIVGMEDSDLKGDDLLNKAYELRTVEKEVDFKGDITTTPKYLEQERLWNQKYNDLKTQSEQEIASVRDSVEKTYSRQEAVKFANKRLMSMAPKISQDKDRAATQMSDFESKFDGWDFQWNEDRSDALVLYSTGENAGKRLEDDQHNPIMLSQFTDNKARLSFDFPEQQQRTSAGNDTPQQRSQGTVSDSAIKDIRSKMMSSDPQERLWAKEKFVELGIGSNFT